MTRLTSAPAGLEYLVINLDGTYGRFPVIAINAEFDKWAFYDTDGEEMDSEIILYTGSLVTTPYGPTFGSLAEFERLTGLVPSPAIAELEAKAWVAQWVLKYE